MGISLLGRFGRRHQFFRNLVTVNRGVLSATVTNRPAHTYAEAYARSIDPARREDFWAEAAKEIAWYSPPTSVLLEHGHHGGKGDDAYTWQWFPGGTTNTCYNCVDRHVEQGRGDQLALIYDSAMIGETRTFTYNDLLEKTATMAGALAEQGVQKGDVVLVYMPMIPEVVITMLACARLGAVHNVVFGGFAAEQLATRITDSEPKVIVSASCGLEPNRIVPYKPLLDKAIELSSHTPDRCIVVQRPEAMAELKYPRDIDWDAANTSTTTQHPCVPVLSEDPLYIVYTSGTTGTPKGIQRENGGHMVALNWSLPHIYGIDQGDVWWAASDVGWIVGCSYIVYAPLLRGCTSVMFEGKPVGTPDAGEFWRVIADHKVKGMFTAPTAVRAIKKEDPEGNFIRKHDLSRFEALFLAGERTDPATVNWVEAQGLLLKPQATRQLNVPVIDHWWQTETGFPISSNFRGFDDGPFPIKPGSSTFPVPGWDVRVLGEDDHRESDPITGEWIGEWWEETHPNTFGTLAAKLPLPPCAFTTLYKSKDRFQKAYMERFPSFYDTADAGMIDDDGYLSIMTRTDDIINVAGHRLSTGAIEEVLTNHPSVAECAVLGVSDTIKGQLPLGLIVVREGAGDTENLEAELVAMVRESIGPVAAFKSILQVPRLPKTRSGKILRGTMQKMFDKVQWLMPSTIEDAAVLDEIQKAVDDNHANT